jgi:2-C-methyl-D-erythritol 2,4-cyclodiphosphate synthase
MRIGQGYDIHRLVEGRILILGGIRIPFERGCEAHSDGDVLIHAVIDALLGAACLGDIGTHFPPSEDKWKDADSGDLLISVMEKIRSRRWEPVNVDSTIILEKPRLSPYINDIRENLAQLLGLSVDCVSVKAKTKEKQDATGEGRSIEAHAVTILLEKSS